MTSSSTIEVLYEDNHLIAVFKPHGMLTQGDATGDLSLLDAVKAFIKERDQKPGAVFLGLLHRLDRPAAGVVLFGKTSKGASRLSEQFRTHEIKKTYQIVVEGKPATSAALIHYLDDAGEIPPQPQAGPGLKRAELEYRTIQAFTQSTLLEVNLKTGRKHQIRKQMAAIGHPVVGDGRYGGKSAFLPGSIALLAHSLVFTHPVRKEEAIEVVVPARLNTLLPLRDKK